MEELGAAPVIRVGDQLYGQEYKTGQFCMFRAETVGTVSLILKNSSDEYFVLTAAHNSRRNTNNSALWMHNCCMVEETSQWPPINEIFVDMAVLKIFFKRTFDGRQLVNSNAFSGIFKQKIDKDTVIATRINGRIKNICYEFPEEFANTDPPITLFALGSQTQVVGRFAKFTISNYLGGHAWECDFGRLLVAGDSGAAIIKQIDSSDYELIGIMVSFHPVKGIYYVVPMKYLSRNFSLV